MTVPNIEGGETQRVLFIYTKEMHSQGELRTNPLMKVAYHKPFDAKPLTYDIFSKPSRARAYSPVRMTSKFDFSMPEIA